MNLYINSADRYPSSNSSSDFYIYLPTPVQNIKSIQLAELSLPNTIYNIRYGVNNYMCWSNGTSYSFLIPPGIYSISSLLSTDFPLLPVVVKDNPFILNWNSNVNGLTSCFKELGWTNVDTSSSNSQVSPNCVSLERPITIFIESLELGNYFITSKSLSSPSPTFVVQLTNQDGNLVFYNQYMSHQKIIYSSPLNLTKLTLTLKNDRNEVINLNGLDWSMNLKIKYTNH